MFGIGLFGASMLAAMIMPVEHRLRHLRGVRLGVGRRQAGPGRAAFFGLFTFVLLVGAVVTLIPGLDLIAVIVGSQYLQGLLLPVVLVFMLVLVNDRRLLGGTPTAGCSTRLGVASVGLVIILDVALLGQQPSALSADASTPAIDGCEGADLDRQPSACQVGSRPRPRRRSRSRPAAAGWLRPWRGGRWRTWSRWRGRGAARPGVGKVAGHQVPRSGHVSGRVLVGLAHVEDERRRCAS